MKKMIKALLIGAGARGATAYSPYALIHPDKLVFVGVAEPRDDRRKDFAIQYNIDEKNVFKDYKDLLQAGIEADVVLVCTQDKEHMEPSMLALEKGYNILVEKPISPNEEDCIALARKVKQTKLSAIVCHVLRYTPFFRKVKELLEYGTIGELVSITHNENVGYFHAAHSYVRGNWRKEADASPMLLAKSCHDIDIMLWLVGSKCKKVSSFGGLKHFRSENAPEGATSFCLGGCKQFDDCPFNAAKIYTNPATAHIGKAVFGEKGYEEIRKDLEQGQYGRCVYFCDNDVVDHQATILEFENGVTATFHMNSLTYDISRTIKLCGTKGELIGKMESNQLMLHIFQGNKNIQIDIQTPYLNQYGHGGGDYALMESLVEFLNGTGEVTSSVEVSVESHLICFAAEKARKSDIVVHMVE